MALSFAPLAAGPLASAPDPFASPTPDLNDPIWLLSPRDSDEATVTATSATAGLPATNVQIRDPRKVWRSMGLTASLLFAFPGPVDADGLGLNGISLSSCGALRVKGVQTVDDLASPPADAVDTGWQPAYPGGGKPVLKNWPYFGTMLRWVNDSAFPIWQLEIADPGNPLGYIDIGRAAFGRSFQPSSNFDVGGLPLARDQRDVQFFSPYGDTLTDRREKSARRRLELQISALDRFDVEEGIGEIQRLAGMWGDVFVSLYPGEVGARFQQYFMQGIFTAPQAHQHFNARNANGETLGASLTIREV